MRVSSHVPGISGMSTIIKQQVEDDGPMYGGRFQRLSIETYQLCISNCIGFSFVDSHPKEIIQICLKNLNLTYTHSNE